MVTDNTCCFGERRSDGTVAYKTSTQQKIERLPFVLKTALDSLEELSRCVIYEHDMGRVEAAKLAIKDIEE